MNLPDTMIPYADRVQVLGEWCSICPACKRAIPLKERKDFESFSGREYAEHYVTEHRRRKAAVE